VREERLLPMGLAEGCTVVRAVPKDATLTYEDVALPEGRLVDELREEQHSRSNAERVRPTGIAKSG
jgi:predicted homoserine dehydrogenase-like protein